MDFLMRPVIRPARIAFASGSRLSSVDGDGTPSFGGRITALADLLPLVASESAVRGYHAVDMIVSSGNPLLAALALRGAAQAGLSAAIAQGGGDDMWPYDLASTDETAQLLASALGMDLPHADSVSAMEWLLTRILAELPRSFPLLANRISPGDRHPRDEGVFFLGDEAPVWRPVDPHHSRLASIFSRFMKGRPVMGKSRKGRTVVFARRLILTARPESFSSSLVSDGLISWAGPIVGHGSARWDLPTYPDAAKGMLEDLIVLARGVASRNPAD